MYVGIFSKILFLPYQNPFYTYYKLNFWTHNAERDLNEKNQDCHILFQIVFSM